MKKLIALLLAAVMVFALCACSSSSSTTETTTDTTEAAAPDAAVPGTEDAAEAEAPAAEAPAAEGGAYTGENVTITFNSSYQETETGGVLATYFKNYLEDLTDGAITVNISYGGTLFDANDELDACGDGAINMMIFGHTKHNTELPVLCSIPDFAPDSVQNALDYFNYVLNDEAAGAAIDAEAEAYGIKYLSVNAGGANYFLANFEFSNLTELIAGSKAFGNMAPAKFEALGFTVVGVFPWDYYSAFDTGLMDASQMDGPAMYSMSLQEVAKYWMPDNTFAAGNFMTVNLDWWNGLSAEAQNAIQEACDATSLFSVEYNQSEYEALNDNLTAAGVTLAEMTDAEFDQWWGAIFDSASSDAITAAQENGNVEAVEAVLQAAADFTGYDIQY
jgi:TRAP-type C4-dicarboxylate transport system substrate-binding protein